MSTLGKKLATLRLSGNYYGNNQLPPESIAMGKTTVDPLLQMIRRLAEDQRLKNLADHELLRQFAGAKDDAAFACLVRRHGPMVLDVCRNVTGNAAEAEDAFQATYLILAQKAKSIRKLTSVGSWLHGVAYRTALKAQAAVGKRQKHEPRAARPVGQAAADDLTWNEIQQLIHAELASLSERDRAPLVLCFLEGRTQDDSAKLLGISKATLKKRLEHGRALLRLRLIRRGLGPTALVAAAAWPAAQSAACVPPGLASGTIKAATALATGQATAGLLSAHVTFLLHNGTTAMLFTKLKIAAAVVMTVALFPAIGAWVAKSQPAVGTVAAKEGETKTNAPRSAPKAVPASQKPPESQDSRKLFGRVLDIAGKPASGAKLFFLGNGVQPVELGQSGADGRFAIAVPKEGSRHYVVAKLEGAGLDFIDVPEIASSDPIELRVVLDNAIKGRVINTEGKAVAGVKVSVTGISADNPFDSVLVEYKKRNPGMRAPYGKKLIFVDADSFLSATTDADGRFVLAGAGVERLVSLRIHGAAVAEAEVLVVNRMGFDPKPYNQTRAEQIAKVTPYVLDDRLLHGPDLSVVAEAQRPMSGVVKDWETGQPRAGIKVRLRGDGVMQDGVAQLFNLTAVTDGQGRYEIRGARKAKSYLLEVANDPAAGFVGSRVKVADKPGYESITADIKVKKGAIVTGRVIDAATKKPLPGFAQIALLGANTFAKDYPGLDPSIDYGGRVATAEDGTFRLVTIPGLVLLMGGLDEQRMPQGRIAWHMYKPAVPDPKYPQCFGDKPVLDLPVYYGPGGLMGFLQGHFCKVLEIKPGTDVLRHDILVEPASSLLVKIQDEAGSPLAGTWVTGMGSLDVWHPIQVKADTSSAFGLEPGKPRLMVFYEPTKNLVGTLALKGDEKEPMVAKLGQPGKVKGRLLTEQGKPMVNVAVDIDFSERTAEKSHEHMHHAILVETDVDGGFEFANVIPGVKFSLQMVQGQRRFQPAFKMEPRSVEAGKVLDFGEVRLKSKSDD